MKILVVDDNRSSANAMSRILKKHGHDVETFFDGASAISALQATPPDLLFTDLRMEPIDGMEVLRVARSMSPPIEVVVFTAFGAVEKAVEAMRIGARDFLTKPISVDQILDRVSSLSSGSPQKPTTFSNSSVLNDRLVSTLEALAGVPSPVWIEGEVGVGRLNIAQRLASLSTTADLTILDPTNAFDWPASGTVVLCDVDELTTEQQYLLLRKLRSLPPDVRLITTARPKCQDRITSGEFRSDLYFSLAVMVVSLPPLRERKSELIPLFTNALEQNCAKYGRPTPVLDEEDLRKLTQYDWPGNLKELNNLAERTAVLGRSGFALRPTSNTPPTTLDAAMFTDGFRLADHLESIEAKLLGLALDSAGGDRTLAGKMLGVERNTLRYKLKKYGLLS